VSHKLHACGSASTHTRERGAAASKVPALLGVGVVVLPKQSARMREQAGDFAVVIHARERKSFLHTLLLQHRRVPKFSPYGSVCCACAEITKNIIFSSMGPKLRYPTVAPRDQRMCMREKAWRSRACVAPASLPAAPASRVRRLRLRQAYSRMLWSQTIKR
jgi:hypothetical protein